MRFHDVTPTLTRSRYADSESTAGEHETKAVLSVVLHPGRVAHRFGLGFIDAAGHARRVTNGPIVPGPYAFAYGLAVCISADTRLSTGSEMADLRAKGLVIDAEIGDVLIFQGSLWRIDPARNDNVQLTEMKMITADYLADYLEPRTPFVKTTAGIRYFPFADVQTNQS